MAQWHDGPDGERWRLETRGSDEYLIVSFPNRAAAQDGIAMRIARGLVLLDTQDTGRVVCLFKLLEYTPVTV